jgi:hypothetical protein
MPSTLRLAFIVIGGCAYTGLAILGWGGFRPFFSHLALIALMVVGIALSVAAFFAGGKLSSGVREARGNRWVLAVFGVIGFLNAYMPAYTDRKELWTLDGETIRWLGVVLLLPVVRGGSGQYLCWANDSAAWSRSSLSIFL